MSDIFMKNNRLLLQNGDFTQVSDLEEIKQNIIVALNTFYEDWLLDRGKGIDYAFGYRNQDFLEHDVKNQIKGVKGVVSIINFTIEFDRTNLGHRIIAGIKTIYGHVDINTGISIED